MSPQLEVDLKFIVGNLYLSALRRSARPSRTRLRHLTELP